MREDILRNLQQEIYDWCQKESNKFGIGCYYHIEAVVKNAENHRGSVSLTKNTPEELCVADADAISHFDSVPSLLYLAYVEKGMGIKEGKEFVKAKLARSFRKLSIESKKYYQDKFEKVMEVLGWQCPIYCRDSKANRASQRSRWTAQMRRLLSAAHLAASM